MFDYSPFTEGIKIAVIWDSRWHYATIISIRKAYGCSEYAIKFNDSRYYTWYHESQLELWEAIKICSPGP